MTKKERLKIYRFCLKRALGASTYPFVCHSFENYMEKYMVRFSHAEMEEFQLFKPSNDNIAWWSHTNDSYEDMPPNNARITALMFCIEMCK